MTTSNRNLFSNLAIPPGETLAEELEFRDIPPIEMADRLGLSGDVMFKIFTGEQVITPDIAAGLEKELGISAQLWLRLEARYRETLARIAANKPGNGDIADKPAKADIAAD